jgi:hypothetical protein
MREIQLTRGMVAIVDDADFERVNAITWHAQPGNKTFYARTGKTKSHPAFAMHQFILGEFVVQIDHKNGNGLDNRRGNLRRCTHSQNLGNTTSHADSLSRFKGVGWSKVSRKWRAYIQCDRRPRHLGVFNTEIEAARAYDAAALELFGEFARFNFPGEVKATHDPEAVEAPGELVGAA